MQTYRADWRCMTTIETICCITYSLRGCHLFGIYTEHLHLVMLPACGACPRTNRLPQTAALRRHVDDQVVLPFYARPRREDTTLGRPKTAAAGQATKHHHKDYKGRCQSRADPPPATRCMQLKSAKPDIVDCQFQLGRHLQPRTRLHRR